MHTLHDTKMTMACQSNFILNWNVTQTDYSRELCIHTLFEAQAARSPDAIAVTFGEQQLSYSALNQRANQLAHELRHLGVGPEVLVAVCMERSPELIMALLAILKAGGAYVPLDPAYPSDRLAFMLDDTKVRVLLVATKDEGRRTIDDLAAFQIPIVNRKSKIVNLQSDWPMIARQPTANLITAVTTQSIAYVIYTSGSTGQPKGVSIAHSSVLNLVGWHQCTFELSSADRTTHLASPSFDAAVWELWPYLTIGASVHIPNAETRVTPLRLRDWLIANVITIGFLPTPLAESIVTLAWPAATALRAILTGGDQLHRFPPPGLPFALFNGYGPTENTVITTAGLIAPRASATSAPDIGQPIANTEVYILDAKLNLVSAGGVGELYVGGAGLARGYLHRPALTAERFVPNPFAATNAVQTQNSASLPSYQSSRLYRTGDLARYEADGTLTFLGRIDGQVKVRGFRIELGEIEAALREHPDVQAALVLAHADSSGVKRLVAYVVPRSDERRKTKDEEEREPSFVLRPSSLASELRSFLATKLPDYMLPAAFVCLEAFPLTANGKINRQVLPVPNTRPDMTTAFVAARTMAEEVIAASWAQALDLEQVGINDNFFELGGDSLRAIRLIARLGERFGRELSVGVLFAHPTVARMTVELAQRLGADVVQQLARAAQKQNARGMAADLVAAPQELLLVQACRSVPQRFPLSFGQQQLWLHAQQAAALPIYNEPFTLRMGGPIQVAALARSFEALVQRHDMLRATIVLEAGQLVQQIQPALTVPLRIVDLQELSPDERESAVLRLATKETSQPFDLTRGPLLRATLVQLAPTDVRLFITAHHIIIDGVSLAVMLQELAVLYHAFANNQLVRLASPGHYADFVEQQRMSLTAEVQTAQLDYWRRTLANLPVLNLPTDHPQPAVTSFRGARQRFAIGQPLTAALKTLGRRAEVSLFVTLLTAFQTLMAVYSGQDDIVVGTVSAGRDRPEFTSLIGYLVNTLALRTDLSGNPTFQELLRRVHEVTVGAMLHQDVPFAQVVQALQPERGAGPHPLFRVAFVLEPTAPAVAAGWNLNQLDVDSGITKWDLVMHLEERPDGLIGRVQYSTDLFDAPTIARLLEHFQIILAGIAANPAQRIADLSILSADERRLLLGDWNATATDYPHEQCIHTLVEAQAARSPDAVAVAFGDQQISYRELDARANQLAQYLRRRGVGPEVCVGLGLERSLEQIVGMLGILKAGGAYVPLDPAYPQERLAFMLEDSQARVLITDSIYDLRLTIDDLEESQTSIVNRQSKIVNPDNLAYVIYTSGSTGRPKGVLVQHRGLCNTVAAMIDAFAITADSRVLQFASLNFDASVSEIFTALVSGARLQLISADQLLPSGGLLQLLHDQAITTATLPPSLLALLPADQLPTLRTVISAGESCSVDIAARWSVGRSFINAYGPTEASICSTMALVDRVPDASSVTIGCPIANTQIYLLDANRQPVPIGVVGEMFIGGAGVTRGYLNQPALTAERFVPNPFVTTNAVQTQYFASLPSSNRLYKTGDLARYRADGTIEFLGRIDGQVKLRGFRIEVGEVEAALERHPTVRAAVVLAREDRPGDKQLVAYVVTTKDDRRDAISCVSTTDLRDYLKQRLPAHMLPTAFVCLEAFPLTPNGKVDRRALPAPVAADARAVATVAPHTPMERMIAAIWQELLGIDSVGLYDNFYDLGGHSLLISQMYTKLRAVCDHDLAIVDLFTYTTIHQLASYLSQQPERLVAAPMPAADYQLSRGTQRLQQMRQRKRG